MLLGKAKQNIEYGGRLEMPLPWRMERHYAYYAAAVGRGALKRGNAHECPFHGGTSEQFMQLGTWLQPSPFPVLSSVSEFYVS